MRSSIIFSSLARCVSNCSESYDRLAADSSVITRRLRLQESKPSKTRPPILCTKRTWLLTSKQQRRMKLVLARVASSAVPPSIRVRSVTNTANCHWVRYKQQVRSQSSRSCQQSVGPRGVAPSTLSHAPISLVLLSPCFPSPPRTSGRSPSTFPPRSSW